MVSLLGGATAGLDVVGDVDTDLDALAERARALGYEADDLAGELRRYLEGLDADPQALEAADDRLTVLDRLKRKHGGTVEAVLDHAATCRARRDELQGAEVALEDVTAELEAARADLQESAAVLHETRAAQAPIFAEAVRERLGALAMEAARFEVDVTAREPTATGADSVEFLIAANPGVPAGPLRDIASGGELSRVMLAIMGVANDGGGATLVFDEVDAGIGGVTARAVGEQLRTLGAGRQVVCITHLPQIASLAARHFSIEKDVTVEPAVTTVRLLEQRELVGSWCGCSVRRPTTSRPVGTPRSC